MNPARLLYRTRQFWQAVRPAPAGERLRLARSVLAPPQMALFRRMSPDEQAHGWRVLQALQARGETHPDLLVAALLHDVGKSRCPLRLWERVLIVLGRALFPSRVRRWEKAPARGWRRAFAVAGQHPEWGAAMAAEAGVSPLAAALIRRHQDIPGEKSTDPARLEPLEERLLRALQAVDDES